MASSLPSSGSLSAGTKAGAERSVNLFKNNVVTPTSFNSKFSLKASSDALAAAQANGVALPRMVVGPPYKFSELYGAGTVRYKQIIGWTVGVDGSDWYKWTPGVKGLVINNLATLLSIPHGGGQKLSGTVTNVYNSFRNKPNRVFVRVEANQCVTQINGVQILSTGNNSSAAVNVTIDILPESNGSFSYKTGNLSGNWGGGITTVSILEQPDSTGTLLVTHRRHYHPSKAGITSMLFLNDTAIAVHSLIGQGKVGTTILPFNIIEATKASITWSGRDFVSITEYPTAENGYSTTVLINDDPSPSVGSYAVQLTLQT